MKTVQIVVDGQTWQVPRGFGAEYQRQAKLQRNALVGQVRDLLLLVGYDAAEEIIAAWPFRKQVEASVYAVNVHLRASDNILPSYPRPDWLPEPFQGPIAGEGIFAGPTETLIGC
jgi:hypothetical protein